MTRILSMSFFCLLSGNALAQSWFAGGSIGQARQQDFEVGGPVATRDDTDTAARLIGGYLVTPTQGIVASYVDLGETYYDGPAFGGFTDKHKAEGFDISYLVLWRPRMQDRVSLFGTVGVFAWDQEVRFTDATGTILFKDEGTSFSLGGGANINLAPDGSSPWGIHVQYQLFKDVGDNSNSGHEIDRDSISVGATYMFGRN